MGKSELGITDTSKSFCQTIFEKEQTMPQDLLFCDDLFPTVPLFENLKQRVAVCQALF